MVTGLASIFKSSKSTKDVTGLVAKEYPTNADDYELLEDCGRGVSATVHKVRCIPLNNEIMAVKKMNLESVNCSLDDIIRETSTMRNYHHPNVLPLYTSFVDKSELWMVMPLVTGGSVLHIMKYNHPDGLDEVSIATIMRDVLKALDYVHRQGGIHRDIKAGNILVDKDGSVYLADFGVSTSIERGASWGNDKQSRMTFVGTPCWMAPEVMEQTAGYDNAADIWSFGITLLEMAHGHAPFAKFSPMKVLLMTLQNPPPTLDDQGRKQFSKAMKDLVTRCLQKDPRVRPTAAQLLEHKFFKIARDEEYLAKHLLGDVPPLGARVQEIRNGRAATSQQENEAAIALSVEEYKKGVSSWNFDVAALKAQAELEPDDGVPSLSTIAEAEEEAGQMSVTASTAAAINAAISAAAPTAAPGPPVLASASVPIPATAPDSAPAPPPEECPSLATASMPVPMNLAATGGLPAAGSPGSAFAVSSSQTMILADILQGTAPVPPPLALNQEASAHTGPPGVTSPRAPLPGKEDSVAVRKGRFQIYNSGAEEHPPILPEPLDPRHSNPSSARPSFDVRANNDFRGRNDCKQADEASGMVDANSSTQALNKLPGAGGSAELPAGPPNLVAVSMPSALNASTGSSSHSTAAAGTVTRECGGNSMPLATVSMPLEPKKKGRFMIIENATSLEGTMSKVASNSSMGRISESGGSGSIPACAPSPSGSSAPLPAPAWASGSQTAAGLGGKPPVPPPSGAAGHAGTAGLSVPTVSTTAAVPVSFLLPKLYELLETSAQQQMAIQKLATWAVEHEISRSSSPPSHLVKPLSRPLSESASPQVMLAHGAHHPSRLSHIASTCDAGAGASPDDVNMLDSDAMRARLMAVETDNQALRLRIHFLEGLLGPSMNLGTTSHDVPTSIPAHPAAEVVSPPVLK